jgi:hypothetical protein
MITTTQYFERHKDSLEITDKVRKNAEKLIGLISTLLSLIPYETTITSGFRTTKHNEKIGGSPNSAHTSGEACDLADPEKIIGTWCLANVSYLAANGLYMEQPLVTLKSPDPTKRWTHLTIRAPKSRATIFFP